MNNPSSSRTGRGAAGPGGAVGGGDGVEQAGLAGWAAGDMLSAGSWHQVALRVNTALLPPRTANAAACVPRGTDVH